MSLLSFDDAQRVIIAAQTLTSNSESNDQEIDLLNSFFDSALSLLTQDQWKLLAESIAQVIKTEVNSPTELQTEYIDQIKGFVDLR